MRKRFITAIQFILGATILGVAALLFLDHFKVVETVKPFVVMSGSMEPAVKLGSVVVVRPQPAYRPGEIITYALNGDKENPITHRIVFRQYPEGLEGEPVYLTAGDANEEFDRLEVRPADIVGKVFFSVPYLGYAVDFAKRPYGFIFLVIVPATIVIYEELKFIKRELASFLNTISERFFKKKFPTQLPSEDSELPKAAAFVPILGATLILASLTGSFFFDLETSLANILGVAETYYSLADHLVINEVYYDVDGSHGTESDNEWVEIYNPTDSSVNLKDWKITDNSETQRTIASADTFLGSKCFAVLSKDAGTFSLWAIPGTCANGETVLTIQITPLFSLSNDDDRVILFDDLGSEVDKMSYLEDMSAFNPSATDVVEGHSLERDPDGVDTDTAADFVDLSTPTPGS